MKQRDKLMIAIGVFVGGIIGSCTQDTVFCQEIIEAPAIIKPVTVTAFGCVCDIEELKASGELCRVYGHKWVKVQQAPFTVKRERKCLICPERQERVVTEPRWEGVTE